MNSFKYHQNKILDKINIIIIKVGSKLLLKDEKISYAKIKQLVSVIDFLRKKKKRVLLVSSGAISSGISVLRLKKRPEKLNDLQALASLGQNFIISFYQRACREFGFHCGQILLTHRSFKSREQKNNFFHCLSSMFKYNILPIINENDAIATEEICFGDNDNLASIIAVNTKTSFVVIFTNTDGFFLTDEKGNFTQKVDVLDTNNKNMIKKHIVEQKSIYSKGGIKSKLKAAKKLKKNNQFMLILNGKNFNSLKLFFKGRNVGTLCV